MRWLDNADNAEKLVNLQATKKKLQDSDQPKQVTNNNTLFVGSTAELQAIINKKKND
jgi:hypothetical protein